MTKRPWTRPGLAPLPQVQAALQRGGLHRAERSVLEPLVVDLAASWWPPSQASMSNVRLPAARSTGQVLDWLAAQPGDTWQARWDSSGADPAGQGWYDLAGIAGERLRTDASYSMAALLVLRAVRPSLTWLLDTRRIRLWEDYACYHDAELFVQLRKLLDGGTDLRNATRVSGDLVRLCLATGKGLRELTREDFLQARATLQTTGRAHHTTQPAWFYARQLGLLPHEPMTLPVNPGRLSPAEFVDRYGVTDPGVRGVFVDYLTERATDCDYSTLQNLAYHLIKLFWGDLQSEHPGLSTLALTREQATAWRARAKLLPDGRTRRNWADIMGTVRAFYLDLSAWAQDDPARWAPWVAVCPVPPRASRETYRARHGQKADMQARTRRLAPVLPQLVAAVTQQQRHSERLLTAAQAAEPGESFTVAGQTWTRYRHRSTWEGMQQTVLAVDPDGRKVSLTQLEDQAFWTWAAIEVLQHSGIRIEEMLELTHLSIRPFRKPSGEVIPLLQIAPSKSDRERVLPASPALARVLSRIVARHTALTGNGTVPLLVRLDEHERTYSDPMPFLFQRRWISGRNQAMSSTSIRRYLAAAANAAELRDNDGVALSFSPHDFRRLWLTDLMSNGFPIHIAAQLAGHEDLNTTRSYTAIYPTQVFDQYEKFLARRRAERPGEEYRQPTPDELTEFGEHFGRRRVELGDCVRPYGTSCIHEHACIRCDLLTLHPDAADRLSSIETNLESRISAAEQNSWLGDVEQLRVTMSHLQTKKSTLEQMLDALPGSTLTLTHVPASGL